jgi:hypothetical protein
MTKQEIDALQVAYTKAVIAQDWTEANKLQFQLAFAKQTGERTP